MRCCKGPGCDSRLPKLKDSNRLQQNGFCSDGCLIAHWRNNRQEYHEKATRAREKAHRRQKRESRGNDRKHQFKLTVQSAQRLARLLDKGKPCISCSRPDDGSVQFCGGHYLTKGAHPEMALDIRNISGQCNQYCNMQKSGCIEGDKHAHGYKQGLIRRYGPEYLAWLEGPHPASNYDCDQLKAIRKEYNAEIRRLEKGEKPSRNWRAMDMSINHDNIDT